MKAGHPSRHLEGAGTVDQPGQCLSLVLTKSQDRSKGRPCRAGLQAALGARGSRWDEPVSGSRSPVPGPALASHSIFLTPIPGQGCRQESVPWETRCWHFLPAKDNGVCRYPHQGCLPVSSPLLSSPHTSNWIRVIYGLSHAALRTEFCAQLVGSTLGGLMPPSEIFSPH